MNALKMHKHTAGCIILFHGVSILVGGELVLDIGDLDRLDADLIESEATLVNTVVREGDCEGSKVGRAFNYIYKQLKFNVCVSRKKFGHLNISSKTREVWRERLQSW